jgi:hypothetical protein
VEQKYLNNERMIKMNELITRVKEVKETTDVSEVNELVEKNWILLRIVPNEKIMYALGRIED